MSLAEALERVASALPEDAEAIRPANGDPVRLLALLDRAAAARVLSWLLTHEAALASELVDAWAEETEGFDVLLALDDDALPKSGRKVLRRALHRLRSRGIAVPERPAKPVVATLSPVEDEISAGLVSMVDPSGAQLAYLAEPDPSGGARLFEMILDEERGVLKFDVYAASRGRARRFLRELSQRDPLAATPAPVESVRALVRRIAAAQPEDRAPPAAFSEWRSRVGRPPEGARTPGELARDALGDEASRARLTRAEELVKRREIGPWAPRTDALRGVAEKLLEVRGAKIIVSGVQKRERIRDTVREAPKTVFAGDAAGWTAARFDEAAYVLWKAGRDEDAGACLGAGRAFRDGQPAENSVAQAIVEAALGPVLEQLGKEDEESLVVRP